MKQQQQGFTLIELIVVIVILGILAATALPKFANLQNDARWSAAKGAQGAMQSAASLAHAAQLVANAASSASVTLEGTTITMSNGYPDASATGIVLAANITSAGYQISTLGTSPLTVAPQGVAAVNITTTVNTSAGCNAVYTVATTTVGAKAELAGTASTNCD